MRIDGTAPGAVFIRALFELAFITSDHQKISNKGQDTVKHWNLLSVNE